MDNREKGRSRCGMILRANGLVILTLIGVTVGMSIGFGTRHYQFTDSAVMWIGMVGELYLRILKMMIVPLIITAIISVTSSMDPKSNGRISAVCVVYTLISNFIPTVLGCVFGIVIGPGYAVKGRSIEVEHLSNLTSSMDTSDILADLLRNFFPDNLIEATFLQTQTTYSVEISVQSQITVNRTSLNDTRIRRLTTVRSPNILGLVVVCTLFGIASGVLRDVGKPFKAFVDAASEIIMQVLRWIMWLTPIGVASLIAKTICAADNISEDFQKLGMFILAATTGMTVCGLIIPISYLLLRRANPFTFLLSLSQPILMAFATANSPITMPAVMTILETEHAVDKRVSRFVMPFVMTLSRSGTAFYIAVSSIFVCQMLGTTLNAPTVMLICLLTTITSTGMPPVPSSALMGVIIVVAALNIPTEAVTLLYTFDWLLDRIRTIVNLMFQAFAAILTQDLCGKYLPSLPGDNDVFRKFDKDIP
ncbi:putative sodium-dependent excitatory amino acid transporter glt-6 [Pecten maximus]|uniref:putative sodium-dependent excitatory amino acid transporter glt-6 n=1 Tax=Pecten maximus TaxID=6579 RepID=UPI00145818B2|nr:putative sodium-dependent excitatory amino acid transporter glt-6 [Pecten maximus]